MSNEEVRIYDAESMVVGRLGSKAAKAALLGDRVIIVNAEKAIITGDRRTVIEAFKEKLNIRTSYNPRKGPFHERRPDRMVRKMIRGMLPWPTPRGKDAYKRIRVYMGVPDEYTDTERIVLEGSRYRSLKRKYITVADLSQELGWRNPEVA
ncbi:50S ribosomal protein L13 [Candidatus Thorarchaeota archaeon]|jgi:large subunit ribosomal protein L13|nr:MAG: 50S ribosomal protein L13 [Candidatus Thorarchaeota archaeon]